MTSDQERAGTTERQQESEAQQQTWSTSAAEGERSESSERAESTERREPAQESGGGEQQSRLLSEETTHELRTRWDAIQGTFVDNPRNAVNDADGLVSDLLQKVSDTFEQQHHELEDQWKRGEPSTEDLRTALHRYRSLFDRLLKV